MDEAISQIVTYLLSFGLPGVCLIVLGHQYNKKDKRVDELSDTIAELAKEQSKAMAEATGAINAMRELLIMRGSKEG